MPDSSGSLVEYYKRFSFSFPSFKKLTLTIFVLSLTIIALNLSLTTLISLGIILLLPQLLRFTGNEVFSTRRLLGISLITILLYLFLEALEKFFYLKVKSPWIALNVLFFLLYLSYRALEGKRKLLVITVPLLLFYLVNKNLLMLLHSFLGLAIVEAVLQVIDRLGFEILDVRGSSVIGAYSKAMLAEDPRNLEEIIVRHSEKRRIRLSLLSFWKENKPIAFMAFPEFHFGPFKNVGSSLFPFILSKEFRNRFGVPVLVFHTATTHRVNLASQEDLKRAVEIFLQLASKSKRVSVSPPIHLKCNNIRAWNLFLDKPQVIISFVYTLDLGLEDISEEITSALRLKRDYIVVDCHSSTSPMGDISPRPENDVGNEIIRCLSKLKTCNSFQEKGSIRVGRASLPRIKGEVGSSGVWFLELKIADKSLPIVLFDANNMLLEVRKKLGEKHLIATTDTHEVAGRITGKGYTPLGSRLSFEILENAIKDASSNALEFEQVEFRFSTATVNLKVIGEKTINYFKTFTGRGLRYSTFIFLYLLTSPLLLLA
ncbi:MAG TPA: DUF2070 family protein [Thermoproteales archaeon]|nr:DUF2070 family protein [Thermoproteales archaeon]